MFFSIYKYRHKFFGMLKNTRKDRKIRYILQEIFDCCKIRYNALFTSILLPIILVILVSIYDLYFGTNVARSPINLFQFLQTTITAPIWEELFYRGIILGLTTSFFFYIAVKKLRRKDNKLTYFVTYTLGLVLISIFFSINHSGKIDIRFLDGIIYGFVYLVDNKNILPAIIGHSLNNVVVFLMYGVF